MIRKRDPQTEIGEEVCDNTPETAITKAFYSIPKCDREEFQRSRDFASSLLKTAQALPAGLNKSLDIIADQTIYRHILNEARTLNGVGRDSTTRILELIAALDADLPVIDAWLALTPEQQEEQKQIIAELRQLIKYRNYLVWVMKVNIETIELKVGDESDNTTEGQLLRGIFDVKNEAIKALHAKVIRPSWLRQFVQEGRPGWLTAEFNPTDFDELEHVN